MLELLVFVAPLAALVGAGLGLWRILGGKPRRTRDRVGRGVAVTVLAFALLGFATWRLIKASSFQLAGEIVDRVETNERVVALTFDDGPTERVEEVLAILRERGVKATFFVVGREIETHPGELERIVREGHEVGNHSYSHTRMVGTSAAFVRDEIERADTLIRAAGYDGEILFRPPYGKKLLELPRYLAEHGRQTVMWDVEPDKATEASPDEIARVALEGARPGSIILLHTMYEGREASIAALPAIIDGLRSRGYTFTTVSQLEALAQR